MSKNKPQNVCDSKCKVIIYVLDYLEFKKSEDIEQAIEYLTKFAAIYNIPLKKVELKYDLKISLREFITSEDGYLITIPKLFNALYFCT